MINPIAFRPGPVTFWTTLVYLALLIPIVIVNEEPPSAPAESPYDSVNLTQAWLDLTTITRAYHPYNSHANDDVRNFLLQRVASILDHSGISWTTDGCGGYSSNLITSGLTNADSRAESASDDSSYAATVFDDLTANSTFLMGWGIGGTHTGSQPSVGAAAYFEGTNIIVYIRGKSDDNGKWWQADAPHGTRRNEKGLTLVNAHYDS